MKVSIDIHKHRRNNMKVAIVSVCELEFSMNVKIKQDVKKNKDDNIERMMLIV
ncbi:conserved hypothetical protein [Xenorhabdus bovienii str. Jollieti]|nr:conserved hypothetical protein [Xenorhabdus bovienii str. Jollieti]